MGEFVNFCAGAANNFHPKIDVQGVLISAAFEGKNESATRRALKMVKKMNAPSLILDSGGFQINQHEVAGTLDSSGILKWLTPRHVMNVASKVKPTIVMALDFPIKKETEYHKQNDEFAKKIMINLKWSRECITLRPQLCPESELFIPLQCYNTKQIKFFLQNLGPLGYDGVSFPTRNSSISSIISNILAIYNTGIRKIHILGTSTLLNIGLAAFMAKNFFEWVSIDSTGWRQHGQYGKYFHPEKLYQIQIKQGKTDYPKMECQCPWCQHYTIPEISALPPKEQKGILSNHSFWVLEKACQESFNQSKSIDSLHNFLKPRMLNRNKKELDKLIDGLHLFEMLAGDEDGSEILMDVMG